MTLNLSALTRDVEAMSETRVHLDQARRSLLQIARERLDAFAKTPEAVQQKVQLTRDKNLHWRGAYLAGDEPLNAHYARPDMPSRVNVIANDGSQVFIDPHAAAQYYALNIGYIVYAYGTDQAPHTHTEPSLHYRDDELFDSGYLISNTVVNVRRTIRELQNLANLSTAYAQKQAPAATLSDGPLMWVHPGNTPQERRNYLDPYLEGFDRLLASGVALGGYVDRPRSTGIISLLHLGSLEEVNKEHLAQTDLVGLTDVRLFGTLLGPGERSALFILQSPTNRDYTDRGHEIYHCYINVSRDPARPLIARLEMPSWTAQDPARRDLLHAVIWQQCRVVGGYPYVLARAHELALISTDERRDLDEMVVAALRRRGLDPRPSEKAWQKGLTGGAKRRPNL